jgi:hypothetical protein
LNNYCGQNEHVARTKTQQNLLGNNGMAGRSGASEGRTNGSAKGNTDGVALVAEEVEGWRRTGDGVSVGAVGKWYSDH